jgi:electron transport complex protein RnfG
MRSTVMLVVVLTLVCLISALALALVNSVTQDRIAEQKRLAELRAVSEALLHGGIVCDNDPSRDAITIPEWKGKDDAPKRVCLGRKEGKVMGVAFTSAGEGYGGHITIMMGVDLTGKLTGIEILEHLETPGLGANIESAELFRDQFKGKYREGSPTGKLKVVKGEEADDNWEIEALTGATVSPTGVVQAINDGLVMFDRYKDEILAKAEGGTQ